MGAAPAPHKWKNTISAAPKDRWLLLFWPIYLTSFYLLEARPASLYRDVFCPLDAAIPFCEYFWAPYLLWHALIFFMVLGTFWRDGENFRRLMRYFIVTYAIIFFLYLFFPTAQALRPAQFPRDNLSARIVELMYAADTNTNVCPSMHVVGALNLLLCARRMRRFSSAAWKAVWLGLTILICLSTVFLKQHSVLDLLAALPVSAVGWWFAYREKK